MQDSFIAMACSYAAQLSELTRRLFQCSPSHLVLAVPMFVISQVALLLSLMLPLKVIIMLGSDGVPRYFQFFMTEETRDTWIYISAAATVVMFLLYILTGWAVTRIARSGAQKVLEKSNKIALFDGQDRFAEDIFERVTGSLGTLGMAVAGIALGFLIEWRLMIFVLISILLEFALFSAYWDRLSAPDKASERERLVAKRTAVLQNLSTFNVLLVFAGLVYLLYTDPTMNFVAGVLLFLLARQILIRSVRLVVDASFFRNNFDRIKALAHPKRNIQQGRMTERQRFEAMLMPAERAHLLEFVEQKVGIPIADRRWTWCDTKIKGSKSKAVLQSPPSGVYNDELYLKFTMREGDAGLAREVMYYKSDSAKVLRLSRSFVHTGAAFGRGYLLLRSRPSHPCPRSVARKMALTVRERLWSHCPDRQLTEQLLKSFPPLGERITNERIARLRLACKDRTDISMVEGFIIQIPEVQKLLNSLPHALCVNSLSEKDCFRIDSEDNPMIVSWENIGIEPIGADLKLAELEHKDVFYKYQKAMKERGSESDLSPSRTFAVTVYTAQVDSLIEKSSYAAALALLPTLLEVVQ